MSIQAVAWALEQDLPARPKLVLVSIANHANHTDGYCYLRTDTIAREAACNERSVYRFIGALIRNGYLRKQKKRGDDGKQRANDYWMLLAREEAEWDWGAQVEEDGVDQAQNEPEEGDEAPTQDVVEPGDTLSPGENAEPGDSHDTRQAQDSHVLSPGPGDNRVTRKRIAEPSESNSKASSAGARVPTPPPRVYRPPPPQPMGADTALPVGPPIFVYENSRAYEAWSLVKSRERGLRIDDRGKGTWRPTTSALIDGHWRRGWYFPTLFPPGTKSEPTEETKSKSTGPPKSSAA